VDAIRNASIMMFLGLIVSAIPMFVGIAYAMRPNERRLALMRPLSLAGIFAAICTLMVGLINVLRGLSLMQSFDAQATRGVFVGMAEAIVPTFVGFACLTVAWLCVAMGMRKTS
jgi:hypothetical protein